MSMKKLLMGNEAIARGAVEAGVQVAAAYPGTPSSEVFSTLAELSEEHGFYAEWSVNEKVALEVAAGAAYAGARAIVSMKQVGLNVAADPLMTLAYIGVKGGLVMVVADDPGPHSSQNEQDTRKFAQFAKLPVFDPASPQEAKDMTVAAFELSEQLGLPVFLRPTTRTCHVCQDVTLGDIKTNKTEPNFVKDPSWVIFPPLALKKHKLLNQLQDKIGDIFSQSPFNHMELKGRTGIITSGVAHNYVVEALEALGTQVSLLKLGNPYPMPKKLVQQFMEKVDRVLIVEELEPVVEDQVIALAWKNGLSAAINGKHDGLVPREGEFNVNVVKNILSKYLEIDNQESTQKPLTLPPLPQRAPTLCAGCPHRASFFAIKEESRKMDAVLTGDIGCYTLGVMPPLNATDTCLCMGASVTLASGLSRVEKNRKHIAFLGDSTFFHTGLPGLINAVYNNANITLVVLDNRTTAMTGHQPHPGLLNTATGVNEKFIDIVQVAKAIGVGLVLEVDPYDLKAARNAAKEAIAYQGTSVVVMRRECVAIVKSNRICQVNEEKCIGCNKCIKSLGCPALEPKADKVLIGNTCNGCTVCAQVCPSDAIEEVVVCG